MLVYLVWAAGMLLCYAKSLQSCPTLCDSIDGSPPGSPVPGILQTRTLEWVAISFSNAWKWSRSVMSDSSWPHGLQPSRLLRPQDFPGKSTGVGCHLLLRVGILDLHKAGYLYVEYVVKWSVKTGAREACTKDFRVKIGAMLDPNRWPCYLSSIYYVPIQYRKSRNTKENIFCLCRLLFPHV